MPRPIDFETLLQEPPSGGELLGRFLSKGGRPHHLSRTAFYEYMVSKHPTNRWLKGKKDDGRADVEAFSKRIASAEMGRASYADVASLAKPLVSFYQEAAAKAPERPSKQEEHIKREALELARLAKAHFVNGLGETLFEEPFLSAPLHEVFNGLTADLVNVVLHPERSGASLTQRSAWTTLCSNGDTDLYRTSITLFRLKHLSSIDSERSDINLLQVTLLIARISITFADYVYARKFCNYITQCPDAARLSSDRLRCYVTADRVAADAASYLNFENSRQAIDATFGKANQRLQILRRDDLKLGSGSKLKAIEWDALERDLISAWLRSAARAKVFDQRDTVYTMTASKHDVVRIKRFKELLAKLEAMKNDRSLANRFVHQDTLARSTAILLGSAEDIMESETLLMDAIEENFIEDEQEAHLLRRMGKENAIGKHKRYRIESTWILIRIQKARHPDVFDKGTAIEEAKSNIREIVKLIGVDDMFHTRIEVELYRALVMQVQESK